MGFHLSWNLDYKLLWDWSTELTQHTFRADSAYFLVPNLEYVPNLVTAVDPIYSP